MALEKKSYLYRVRALFDIDGNLSLVETVHREVVVEDGNVVSQGKEDTRSYPADALTGSVAQLVDAIKLVGIEEDARRAAEAEAKRVAAVQAAAAEAERLAEKARKRAEAEEQARVEQAERGAAGQGEQPGQRDRLRRRSATPTDAEGTEQ